MKEKNNLGCWPYLHPNRGHGSVLMRLQHSDPIFNMESTLWGQHLISNPNIGLLCWLEENGQEELGLLMYLKGSSGLQIGPGWRRGPGLESMDNLWEEGSVFLQEGMLQFFRLKYMISWPVPTKFNCMLEQRSTWIFALRARWLWKPFRPPEGLHW